MGGAEAVSAGVAAAEDDDVLAFGGNKLLIGDLVAEVALVLQGQVIHGEMDALELAAGDGEVAGFGCAAAEDDCVKITTEVFNLDVEADVGAGDELDAFFL